MKWQNWINLIQVLSFAIPSASHTFKIIAPKNLIIIITPIRAFNVNILYSHTAVNLIYDELSS